VQGTRLLFIVWRTPAERAAHLVDHVLPDVPIRQWVLSLPYRLRYQLAWDHDLCRTVVGVALRVVLGFLRRRARQAGVRGGRSGAVAIIQRFGGALNLNVHIHALVIDGVFAAEGDNTLRFHPVRQLTRDDVAAVVAAVARRIERLLQRRGLTATPEEAGVADRWTEAAPALAGLAAASVQGLPALGPQAGARVARFGSPPEHVAPTPVGPCHAHASGFDLHAAIVVRAGERERLERLYRYTLRPPLAQARLRVSSGGGVWIRLRHVVGRHDGSPIRSGVVPRAAGRPRAPAADQSGAVLRGFWRRGRPGGPPWSGPRGPSGQTGRPARMLSVTRGTCRRERSADAATCGRS
jgi:hypothetical protein